MIGLLKDALVAARPRPSAWLRSCTPPIRT